MILIPKYKNLVYPNYSNYPKVAKNLFNGCRNLTRAAKIKTIYIFDFLLMLKSSGASVESIFNAFNILGCRFELYNEDKLNVDNPSDLEKIFNWVVDLYKLQDIKILGDLLDKISFQNINGREFYKIQF